METIEEHSALHGSINLVILKTEIVSALSAVGSATSIEELRQADAVIARTSEPGMANKLKWIGWP
jgi:hypothetical protein